MKGKKRIILSISVLFILVSITGCIDKDNNRKEIQILKSDTIQIIDTIYGEVNVSYQHIREIDGSKSAIHYINLTLNIENPTDDLHYIRGRYERPQEGGWGGGGSVRMMKIDNNQYFYNTEQKYDLLDLWFYFYEKGEMVWNDTLKCFDPTSNLTEIISAVFSIDHTASEMMKNLFISDISHGYDWHNINYYNISYNISGSSNPKLIILHFDIDFNEHIIHLFREILYGNNMGRYYSIITLNENEKKVMNSLYFSIAISDEENNRVTSDVIRVIL